MCDGADAAVPPDGRAESGLITYIYGACTDPAHRRKGHMARLLEHSFALDRAAGAWLPR